jgi:YHS domain-containing protein
MTLTKSLIALLLSAGIFVVGCSSNRTSQVEPKGTPSQMAPEQASNTVKDPVCGMNVDPSEKGAIKAEYKGNTYYFCSPTCKKSFEENPEKYIQAGGASDKHEMKMTE